MSVRNKGNTLVVFVTSDRADPYVNCITYAVEHLGVGRVEMVRIAEHGYVEEPDDAKYVSDVLARVAAQLRCLKDGRYIKSVKSAAQEVQDLVNVDRIESYGKAFDVVEAATGSVTVRLAKLREELRIRAQAGCVFDVTALKNNLLVDVVLTLVSLHNRDIYSFELKKNPVYDQGDLYHALSGRDYVYRNLTESDPVSVAVRRLRRWTIGGKFYLGAVVIVLAVAFVFGLFFDSPKVTAVIGMVANVVGIVTLLVPIIRRHEE